MSCDSRNSVSLRINMVSREEPWCPGLTGIYVDGAEAVRKAVEYMKDQGWQFISNPHRTFNAIRFYGFEVGVMMPVGVRWSEGAHAVESASEA